MRVVQLFGFVLAGVVLSGCGLVPLEHKEPYQTITVDRSARDTFDNLTAYPYCGFFWRLDSDFDTAAGSFKIAFHYTGPGPTGGRPTDLIQGRSTADGKTALKLTSFETWITPISKEHLTRLQTGKCD